MRVFQLTSKVSIIFLLAGCSAMKPEAFEKGQPRLSQTMYLMPDGKTLIIRSIIRKFGVLVTQITEQFQKY
jgi:starvation-inducible outer membrane lipoprotein